MLPIITDTAINLLGKSALQIQDALLAMRGERYDIRDLNELLCKWLESSIESLCEDAYELCVTGDRTYASFNRSTFESLLHQIPTIESWKQAAEFVQTAQDQASLALERVA
jgi:hypothetical protein